MGDWAEYTCKSLMSTYGYEWQGDSLLLARENILLDIDDWYFDKFGEHLNNELINIFIDIITHNVIQMDGVKLTIPMTDIPVRIMNWETREMERFDEKEDEISLF